MGSVKVVKTLIEPDQNNMGCGNFTFTDGYSVFDWGTMPNSIPGKGVALAMIAAAAFERLMREHPEIFSHYIGMVDTDGKIKKVRWLSQPSCVMQVNLVRVIKPTFSNGHYDYSTLASAGRGNYLLPLEVIYRNSLPDGCSIFKRLESGELDYHDLGLDSYPVPGQILPKPYFNMTTKLESTDRPLKDWKEVEAIAQISSNEVIDIQNILSVINELISQMALDAGLRNEDGKIELAFSPQRDLMVVDVFGTPDECRFTRNGVQVSKEMLRHYYKSTPWKAAVDYAKAKAKTEGEADWKQFCKLSPEPLPQAWVDMISNIYKAIANNIVGYSVFKDALPLDKGIEIYQNLCQSL